MPKTSSIKPKKKIPFQTIIDAKIDEISGMNQKKIAKKHKIAPTILKDRLERIDSVLNSSLPALSVERQLISEALSEKLKPIKEELSLKSLEIIRKADDIIYQRLVTEPDEMKTADILKASDQYSSRFARITGMEEAPNAGSDPNARTRVVNTFVQNIFNNHAKNLEQERLNVNDTTPTPIDTEYEDEKLG